MNNLTKRWALIFMGWLLMAIPTIMLFWENYNIYEPTKLAMIGVIMWILGTLLLVFASGVEEKEVKT